MRKVVLFVLLVFTGGADAFAASQATWADRVTSIGLQSVISLRCRSYTPNVDGACPQASALLVKELALDDGQQFGVVFKPELNQFFANVEMNRLIDFWRSELRAMIVMKSWDRSLFDLTVGYLGSEERALQVFAVLLQDVSGNPQVLKWLANRFTENAPRIEVEKFVDLLDLIRSVPQNEQKIFFPSILWTSGHRFIRKSFYHFYVPAYLYLKLRTQVEPSYAATTVFLFNYMYENFHENGYIAAFREPVAMQNSWNLTDIRAAFMGINWLDNRNNQPLLYAQNAFLGLNENRLKQSIALWIERFFVTP